MRKKIRNILTSRKLAVIILMIITALLIVGSLFPKVTFLTDNERDALKNSSPLLYRLAAGVTPPELSKSPLFIGLLAVLFIVNAYCIIYRAAQFRKKTAVSRTLPDKYDFSTVIEKGNSEKLPDIFETLPRLSSWHRSVEPEKNGFLFIARSRNYKLAGSLIFHGSLILIIAGGFITSVFGLYAGIVVTEGQTIPVVKENLVEVSRMPAAAITYPEFQLSVAQVKPVLNSKGEFVQYEAGVNIVTPEGEEYRQDIRINQPGKYRGYKISLERYGPAPWFLIRDKKSGKVIYDAFFNLRANSAGHDSIYMPDSSQHFMVRYFPDFYRDGKKIGSRSKLPRNPVFWVYSGDLKGLLKKGEEVELGNLLIKYNEFRQWAYFRVSRDPGETWVFIGSVTGILGLLLRFFRDEKKIYLMVTKEENGFSVKMNGTSRLFPALFEEWLAALWNELNLRFREVTKHE